MPRGTFPDCCCQSRPHGEALLTHTSTGHPPTLAGSLIQPLWGYCSFPLSLGSPQGFVCTSQDKFLFTPGFPLLWKSCNQISLAFKVRFPRDSQSLCQTPRLGSLTWRSKPPQQLAGGLLCHYRSPDCGSSTQRVWDLIL